MKRILIVLALAFGSMNTLPQPTNLIPAPAEYSVRPRSICPTDMASLREKVRISEKALLHCLGGRNLAEELQSYMIRRMERFAHEHGKRIIDWDEILQRGNGTTNLDYLSMLKGWEMCFASEG